MPDEQAAPDETAIPSRSKAITAVSAFMPGTAKRVVLGSRSALMAENDGLRRDRLQPGFEPIPQRQHMRGLGFALAARRGRGGAESGDAGDIFGTGAQPPLLAAAANERIGEGECRRCERTSAPTPFEPADLVGRERQQIGAERADIARRCVRRPAPHRHEAGRPPHARSRQPPRPAG